MKSNIFKTLTQPLIFSALVLGLAACSETTVETGTTKNIDGVWKSVCSTSPDGTTSLTEVYTFTAGTFNLNTTTYSDPNCATVSMTTPGTGTYALGADITIASSAVNQFTDATEFDKTVTGSATEFFIVALGNDGTNDVLFISEEGDAGSSDDASTAAKRALKLEETFGYNKQ